ncbi:MAG: hypothetical protein GY845_37560, partial [Planctomycetes bacterium]|nr:hypothetical protein [Planctomycetota bacterium]
MNLVLEMRRTCIVFLVTLLLLVSSLIPVTIPVIADEDSPMFTEEDCECAAVGMEMISSSAQSTMFGARFKMDDGLSPRLNYETWWFPNPEFSREKYARYLDPDVGFANVAYMRKSVNEGIEKGFNHVIFEDDFANKNERASFIYGPDSGDLEGKRVFIYDDMYITNITAKYFQSESEIKRAMDALEKCIRAVLERKQQGVAATPQEEKEQEGTLTFKHYHPFPLLLEKESLRMPLHGPG